MTILPLRTTHKAAANAVIAKPNRADKEVALKGILITLQHEEQKQLETKDNIYGVKERVLNMFKPTYPWLDRHHIDYYRRKHCTPMIVNADLDTNVSSITDLHSTSETTSSETNETETTERNKGGRSKGSTNEAKSDHKLRIRSAYNWYAIHVNDKAKTLESKQ